MSKINLDFVCYHCEEVKHDHEFDVSELELVDKDYRSSGFQYRYNVEVSTKCECGSTTKINGTVWEYPKGIFNYFELNEDNRTILNENKLTKELPKLLNF